MTSAASPSNRRRHAWRSRHEAPACRQRGSIVVPVVAALLVGLSLLGASQIGYLYYMKRELQNMADFAALAGAQVLADGGSCPAAQTAAWASARMNFQQHGALADEEMTVVCGEWAPDDIPGDGRHFAVSLDPARMNAVWVTVEKNVTSIAPFVPGQIVLSEAGAATSQPAAAFSVGSRLLRVGGQGLVGQLLAAIGLTPSQLDVLSASGLVNTKLTPSGLLQALGLPASVAAGVGTPQELLALQQLTLGQVLDASAQVLSKTDGVAQASLSALNGLISQLNLAVIDGRSPLTLPVRLFGDGGVFALVATGDPASALRAEVNVLDLISTSLLAANGSRLLSIPSLDVAGLVQARVRVIDPPQIAIGGPGVSAVTPQIRVYARVGTTGVPLLGGLLDTLGTRIDLPVIIEVGRSEATLARVCEAPLARDQAEIRVQSSAASICLGGFPRMAAGFGPDSFFSDQNTCDGTVARHPVASVLGLLTVRSHLNLPVLQSGEDTVTLTAPAPGQPPTVVTVTPNDNLDLNRLGQTLAEQVGGGLLGDLLGDPANTGLQGGTLEERVNRLLGPTPAGRSLTEIAAEMRYSNEALAARAKQWASGNVLNGLLGDVSALLEVLLVAPLGDVTCGLLGGLGGAKGVRNCKTPYVQNMVQGNNGVTAVLGLVVKVLEPVLGALGGLLQKLVNDTLGIGLGQSDVSLLSVRCGDVRLVY